LKQQQKRRRIILSTLQIVEERVARFGYHIHRSRNRRNLLEVIFAQSQTLFVIQDTTWPKSYGLNWIVGPADKGRCKEGVN